MTEQSSNQRSALLVVCMSSFIMPMMLSSVNVALPTIAGALQVEALYLTWVSNAYLVTSATLLLPFGKLADIVGRKRVYVSGIITVIIASLLAASSQSIYQLIACRVLQGMGAAMLFSTGVAMLSSVFPPEKRGSAIGMTVSAVYFGLTCGPLFGGWLTQHFSWRSVFLVHLPVALIVALVASLKLKGDWRGEEGQKFDFTGTGIYAVTIISLMIGLTFIPGPTGFMALGVSALGFYFFFRYEATIEHPIFAVKIFRANRVLIFSCLAALILYSSTFGTTFLMSLYLQTIKGISPQVAGMIMIVQPLVMAMTSPFAGRLSDRIEPRFIASAGMCSIATGLGLLSTVGRDTSLGFIIPCLFLTGLGFAFFSSPNTSAIMGSVEKKFLGVAGATAATVRVIGQMFSMAIITFALALFMGNNPLTPEHGPALLQSIRISWLVASCLCVVAVFLSLARGNVRTQNKVS